MPTKYKKRNTAYLHQPHVGKKAPEPEGDIALKQAMGTYPDDALARAFLEKARWPEGACCPHCGSHEVTKLEGKATRPGVYKCKSKGCRKQFTVTVGTIFEASHIRLRHWVIAFHAMCAGKKGVSAHQLHRELGITYKSAWFMCHRIRHAMDNGIEKKLEGVVEADETYMGGKPRPGMNVEIKRGRGTKKAPVAVLVERDGRAICKPVRNVTAKELSGYVLENISRLSSLMTDENASYNVVGCHFYGGHYSTNHSSKQYVKRGRMPIHSNTAESFIALLKRGHYGVYHKMSEKHLPRYCNEFAFRWTHRKATDSQRTLKAIEGAEGKRLTYK